MKMKVLAKRLRRRSDEFRRMALHFQGDDQVSAERALLLADVLLEVADQVSRPSKKKLKKRVTRDQQRKRIALVKVTPAS